MVNQFEVHLVSLDPTKGTEIKKTRPCVIVSPNEMNHTLKTTIVAPLTSTRRNFPSRVETSFEGKKGEVALDQIRAVDQGRLGKYLGKIDTKTANQMLTVLQEIFS